MALTEAERVSVRRHLGMNSASTALYPWVPTFFAVNDILDSLPTATEEECRAILTRISNIETRLGGALDRLQASAVGSIDLNAAEVDQLRRELRRWRVELSTLLGVPIVGGRGEITVL